MTSLDPHRSYPARSALGDDSARLLNDVIDTLVLLRAPMHHGHAGAELHAVTSIIAEANSRLRRVVADARDQQHTWAEIAHQLGTSWLHAVARFAGRTTTRRTPLNPDDNQPRSPLGAAVPDERRPAITGISQGYLTELPASLPDTAWAEWLELVARSLAERPVPPLGLLDKSSRRPVAPGDKC